MNPRFLLAVMAAQLGLNLLGLHGLAAVLPDFIALWSLSESEAGWLSGAPYVCSLLAIPILIGSDRFDARRLVIAGSLANAVGFLGFALLADGFWSGLAFRMIQGIGFAWTYMPGVKVIADRAQPGTEARTGAFYISTFPIVASSSYVCIAWLADLWGWRVAFLAPGLASSAAAVLVWSAIPPRAAAGGRASFDLRPVLSNRPAVLLILANFCHSVQLLALRGWMVAFFAYAATVSPGAPAWDWALLATMLTFLGAPMSMAAGWLGARRGMARVSAWALAVSGTAACVVGFAAEWPFWLLFLGPVLMHNLFVVTSSGSLGGGIVESVGADLRGRAMAVHAFANAFGAFVGPVLFGVALESAGGVGVTGAWGAAFAVVGATAFVGAILAHRASRNK